MRPEKTSTFPSPLKTLVRPVHMLAAACSLAAPLSLPSLAQAAPTAKPAVQYHFNESSGDYDSTGSLRLPLSPQGTNQQHGAPGSGVSGQPKDRAWDSSANTTQGVGDTANNSGLKSGDTTALYDKDLEAFTLCFWYKTEQSLSSDAATRFVMYADRPTAPVGEGFVLRSYKGALELRLGAKDTDGQDAEVIALSDKFKKGTGLNQTDQWVFVAVTWDGTSIMYYIGTDASPIIYGGGAHFKGTVKPTDAPLVIGNTAHFNRGLDGFVDNFRFYDAALPAPLLEGLRKQDLQGPN
ncbi:LamG domain-containing protein [Ruficoccus amylovorans]|uniref:LamG domain-containing protein n=1 Tax=Ruficoccus amylovorans TaxID=1804625 RepID=A0A842HGX6_9BACT|nr:LamG domain-containing protein [Ruficoccus amylovorans]MBC2595248.1 LamG domain-containing protein [Ruficoccus amylovorans]